MTSAVQHTQWHGCYSGNWKGLIVSDEQPDTNQLSFLTAEACSAFIHPAKVARNLVRRIYEHLRDTYGLQPGSTILDVFSGIGGFALDAYLMGYHFVGIELEPRFHAVAQQNLAYWCHKFGPSQGSVTFLNRDSRELRRLLRNTQALASDAAIVVIQRKPYV